jgi:hypothetical protein
MSANVMLKPGESIFEVASPELLSHLLYTCNCFISASADEEGRIHGKLIKSGNRGEESSMAQRLALLEKLIDASKVIAMQLDPFEATSNIIRWARGPFPLTVSFPLTPSLLLSSPARLAVCCSVTVLRFSHW